MTADLKTQVEAAVMARQGKQRGHEIRFICPAHDDSHPSADYNTAKGVWICRVCGESGNYWHLGGLLGVINNGHRPDGWQETRRWNIGQATHKRLEKAGERKRFIWARDGKETLDGLPTANLPLYGIHYLTPNATDILVNEGEKKTDALLASGLTAVGTVTGAQGTPSVETLRPLADFPGRIFLCQDNDQVGRDHMARIAARLKRMGKVAYMVSWPGVLEKGDAYDFIKAGHTTEDVQALLEAAPVFDGKAEPWGYIVTNDNDNQELLIEELINDLLVDFHFATLRDNDEVLIYRDGYYQYQGKQFIKEECQRRVGASKLLTEHKVNEIIGHITRSTYFDRKAFNADKCTLNLTNGLLDTRTRVLRPHTPDCLSTIRIPVTYNSNADCPAIRQFLSEVHHSQDIPVVEEIAGYCLTPDNSIQKAVLVVGGGDQGKSTELSLLKAFIGADNCSNVPWHALELNRFAVSALEGKLANIFADLPSQSLSMVSAFKMLTGGDTIGTEKKFKDYYSFVNYAKLIFSANKPPKVHDEDSYAFWRRWIILNFPNQISEDKKDLHILEKLTVPGELSGFLNIALNGLDRLRTAGRFSYNKSVEATTEYYLRAADPVYAFLQECCEVSPKNYVTKDDLYDAFQGYCMTRCLPVVKPNSFARSLQNQPNYRVSSIRPEVDGKRVTAWQGLRISVRDVKDVKDINVSNLSKGHAKDDKEQVNKRVGKNIGNLDMVDVDAQKQKTTDGENPDANLDSVCDYGAVLGITIDCALELWRSEGAPVIHLRPGENCFDLEKLLSRKDISPEHLEAVRGWLQEHKGGEQC